MSTTTEKQTAALVRQAFHAVPDGARYFVSSVKTAAGGGNADGSRDRLNEIITELRAAYRDGSVGNMTIFVLFDNAVAGESARGQALLPLGETA